MPTTAKRTNIKRYPVVGHESIMCQKKYGSSNTHVQRGLRWSCDRHLAERICNYNRLYTEPIGYMEFTSTFEEDAPTELIDGQSYFYDSNSGKALFFILRGGGRTFDEFMKESLRFGSPFFRDDEVNWNFVRCLPDGEMVSVFGTHLGRNVPDEKGNKYCINLVSIAGRPKKEKATLEKSRERTRSSWIERMKRDLANEALPPRNATQV